MTACVVVAGLLPSSVLSSRAFGVFSAVVAFNTLVYLGLTLARFLPWPRQVHPRTVRDRLQLDIEPRDTAPSEVFVPETPRAPLDRRTAHLQAAGEAIPIALALFATVTLAIECLSLAVETSEFSSTAFIFGFSVLTLIVSLHTAKHRSRPQRTIAIWMMVGIVYVFLNCWRMFVTDDQLIVAQITVVLVIVAPLAMVWRPSVVTNLVMFAVASVASVWTAGVESIPATLVLLTAASIGLILLYLRRRVIDSLLDAQASAYRHATTDPVTGLLTREASIELATNLAAGTGPSGAVLHAIYVGVADLESLVESYGLAYGDDVLRALASATMVEAGVGAIVGRFDDAGLVVVSTMRTDEVGLVRTRLDTRLGADGLALGRRPLRCEVGAAEASVRIGADGTVGPDPRAEIEHLLTIARRRATSSVGV